MARAGQKDGAIFAVRHVDPDLFQKDPFTQSWPIPASGGVRRGLPVKSSTLPYSTTHSLSSHYHSKCCDSGATQVNSSEMATKSYNDKLAEISRLLLKVKINQTPAANSRRASRNVIVL